MARRKNEIVSVIGGLPPSQSMTRGVRCPIAQRSLLANSSHATCCRDMRAVWEMAKGLVSVCFSPLPGTLKHYSILPITGTVGTDCEFETGCGGSASSQRPGFGTVAKRRDCAANVESQLGGRLEAYGWTSRDVSEVPIGYPI